MDRNKVKELRVAVNAALELVGKEFGMSIRVGNMRYSDTVINMPVTASMISEDGVVQTPERTDFIALAKFHGLDPAWIDKEFLSRGDTFRICGLKPRSRKYPVLAKNLLTGKTFKFDASEVVRKMIACGHKLVEA